MIRYGLFLLSLILFLGLAAEAFAQIPDQQPRRPQYKLDQDGDNKISREEFMKGAEERFRRRDTNDDGFIDIEERRAFMEQQKEKWREKRLRQPGSTGTPPEKVGDPLEMDNSVIPSQ